MTALRRRHLLVAALVVAGAGVLFLAKTARKMPDFAVYHRAGARAVSAEPLYQARDGHYQFKYPPVSALLFAPLARLPLPAAKAVWFAIIILSVAGSLALSARLVPGARPATAVVLLTLLVEAKFFGHELTLGQVNAVLLCLMLLAFQRLRAGADAAAGVLLALAISVKPYALVFLPYLGIRRRFRALAITLVGLAAFSAAPALSYGVSATIDLYREWRTTLGASTRALLTSQDNVSLFGLFAKWLGPEHPALIWAVLAAAALLVGLVTWALLRADRRDPDALALDASLLLILMPLLSPLGWDYVFLWSTPGVMLLLTAWPALGRGRQVLLTVTLLLVGATLFDLLGRELYAAFMDWSILTIAFVALIGLLACLRARDGDGVRS